MRITVIRTNRQHQLCVTNRSIGHLLERMLKDDSKFTIQKFRDMVPSMNFGYDGYKDMPTWHRVYPAAEFQKDENGNLRMKAFKLFLFFLHQSNDIPRPKTPYGKYAHHKDEYICSNTTYEDSTAMSLQSHIP